VTDDAELLFIHPGHALYPEELELRFRGRLFQMAVTPPLQGRGLGAHLVAALEAELPRRGFTHVHLHARAHVVLFYERLGYAVYGEPFTEVNVPHRHMRKTLASSILPGHRSEEA
jgi:GNAT superfamily N-acetyltransferase